MSAASTKPKLRREVARWQGISPKAICEGSPAQTMFLVEDAIHDIAALHSQVEALKAEFDALSAMKRELEKAVKALERVSEIEDEMVAAAKPRDLVRDAETMQCCNPGIDDRIGALLEENKRLRAEVGEAKPVRTACLSDNPKGTTNEPHNHRRRPR